MTLKAGYHSRILSKDFLMSEIDELRMERFLFNFLNCFEDSACNKSNFSEFVGTFSTR